jgi:hypothetical protein
MGTALEEIRCESKLNGAGSGSYPEICFRYRNMKFGMEINHYYIMGLYEKTISLWAYVRVYRLTNTYYTQKYERI